MPDPLTTARFALPLLAAGQAQKEVTHNEALTLIDAAIAPRVVAANAQTPPPAATAGQCWALGAAPTGVWAGRALMLAVATEASGWRFVAQPAGSVVIVESTGESWRRSGSAWTAPPLITGPAAGSVVDAECRAAVQALIAALVAQGAIRTA